MGSVVEFTSAFTRRREEAGGLGLFVASGAGGVEAGEFKFRGLWGIVFRGLRLRGLGFGV